MGGLVSGIFDLFSGNPTQKEQDQLGDLSGYETGTGKSATTAANDYYSGILSGDPAQIAKTLAPEIKAGQDMGQQKKDTLSEFGNRGGGTNSAASAIDAGTRGNIIDLIGGAQAGAAAGEAGLGTNLLSQSSGNINSEAGLAAANQKRVTGDVGGIANGAAQIASDFFAPGASSVGGASPPVTPGADFGLPAQPDLSGLGAMGGVPDLGPYASPTVSEGFAGLDY